MRRTVLIGILAALLPAAPAAAAGAVGAPVSAATATGPWATVNVCDTQDHPNELGIRGSMPGLKRKSRMSMRFRVQYRDEGRWRFILSGADSGPQRVAIAKGGVHDAGWSFTFRPPVSGGAYELRGVVTFVWRRGGRVVEREREVTTAGHPGTAGADPEDYSAATCAIA